MKLSTFVVNSDNKKVQKIGVLKKDTTTIIDLQAAYTNKKGITSAFFIDMLTFLDNFEEAKAIAEEILVCSNENCDYKISEITLLAPVPRPRSIRDFSLYEEHMMNCGKSFARLQGKDTDTMDPEIFKPGQNWYKLPIFYMGNTATVGGTGTEIYFPDGENFRDYECELGFYVGKKGKDIKKENALQYIAGFTIFNDLTARNLQSDEMNGYPSFGPAKGKDFDTGNIMGPFLVTIDEFDHMNATMLVRVNGEERTRNNSGTMYHSVESVLERVSKSETVYPGEFIGLGTVGGGSGVEFNRPIWPGDVIELEIEGIGILTNKIIK